MNFKLIKQLKSNVLEIKHSPVSAYGIRTFKLMTNFQSDYLLNFFQSLKFDISLFQSDY